MLPKVLHFLPSTVAPDKSPSGKFWSSPVGEPCFHEGEIGVSGSPLGTAKIGEHIGTVLKGPFPLSHEYPMAAPGVAEKTVEIGDYACS